MKTNYGFIRTGLLLTFCFVLLSGFTPDPLEIEIQVSPNVLNLLNQGEVVTVHTDIAYSLVVGASVYLNGVEIDWWKSDDRGNFVAKFEMEAIKGLDLNIGEMNILTLVGLAVNGEEFTGSEDVKVVLNVPVGGKK